MLTSAQTCSRAVLQRCCASAGGRPIENASRRRSQRLRQPRDTSRGDVRQELREREARAAEMQLVQQELQQRAEEEEAEHVAQRLQEQATRLLLQEEEQSPVDDTGGKQAGRWEAAVDVVPGSAGTAEAAPASAGSSAAPPPGGDEAVEADFILEQQGATALGGQRPQDVPQSEISRQSEALLEIIQAGERVEEVIAEHRADIDGTMLKLLARRIQAAQQMEKRADVVQGLQLLLRRLKAEVDRQRAPPALQLLDELMAILDPGEEAVTVAQSATREERQREAAARVRAAFSGGLPGGADVLSLAQQLSGGGGLQLADELVAEPVDPMDFMAQVTELLSRVQQQEAQLEAFLEQQQARQQAQQQAEGGEGGEVADEEADRAATTAVLEAESLLEQRRAAAGLVQESLSIAEAVSRQLSLGM